jgi:hypothetical protein
VPTASNAITTCRPSSCLRRRSNSGARGPRQLHRVRGEGDADVLDSARFDRHEGERVTCPKRPSRRAARKRLASNVGREAAGKRSRPGARVRHPPPATFVGQTPCFAQTTLQWMVLCVPTIRLVPHPLAGPPCPSGISFPEPSVGAEILVNTSGSDEGPTGPVFPSSVQAPPPVASYPVGHSA